MFQIAIHRILNNYWGQFSLTVIFLNNYYIEVNAFKYLSTFYYHFDMEVNTKVKT